MGLRFHLQGGNSGVIFQDDAQADAAHEQALDQLLIQRDAGTLSDGDYVAGLEQLLAQWPACIAGHAHLASAYFELGQPGKALNIAQAGLAQCQPLIPDDFDGALPWDAPQNRPFLRVLQVAVLACVRLQRHGEAVRLIEAMLRYDPDDHQGMRLLLGSEYLRVGRLDEARALFHAHQQMHPSYCYELALSGIQVADWQSAATALRQGFARNPYIAERLCGVAQPEPWIIWHSSTLDRPETAHDYLDTYGGLWQSTSGAVAFLGWLYRQPDVLRERADILACREALRWEREGRNRAALSQQYQHILQGIDDRLSIRLVRQRHDLDGALVYPWLCTRHL